MQKIKLIIFDAYGVTLTGGYPDTCKFLGKKYRRDWKELYGIIYKKYFNQAAERKITQQAAWERAIKELGLPLSVKEIKKIHYDLKGLNKKVIIFLPKIDKNIKVLLLSKNTRSQFADDEKNLGFRKYFKNVINTWEIGLPKASAKTIFYLSKKFKVKPEEMIFIDDQPENLVEAEKLGVMIILYKNFEQFKKDLIRNIK